MLKMLFAALLCSPSLIYGASSVDHYSDIKKSGLHVFLTESFKLIKDIKQLPPNLVTQLEQNQFNDMEDRFFDEFTDTHHFRNFKMDLAGISDKYFFICYQTQIGESAPFCHLFVFLKGRKNKICFKDRIPEPVYYDGTLKGLRDLEAGNYRKEQKRKNAESHWMGNSKNGWVNLITKMHLKISGDGKSLIATGGFGNILWAADVSSMWAGETFYSEKLFPRKIANVGFDEGLIYVYWGKCWGQIDEKTGVFTFDGCD